MKINSYTYKVSDKRDKLKKNMNHKEIENTKNTLNKKDQFIKTNKGKNPIALYDKNIRTNRLSMDKGTAAETTIQVNRSTFDKIMNESTFGETKWEECGVDNDKRWVVVNGQRFEVEHSAEEKARRKNASKTLLDFIEESEERMNQQEKIRNKDNIKALKNNKELMDLLRRIFNTKNPDKILGNLG